MYLLLIMISITTITFCSSKYQYLCPTNLNWRIRSKTLCNNTVKYSCLHDENKDTSREICRETPRLLAAGNKYVIRGNLDGKNCNESRYQPFIFRTNESSICVFKKSYCREKGQILFSNGSTTEDKSCRCDYSKSYAPIQKPFNPCHCVPSAEDCSCYLKLCPDKTHLSAEYTCVSDFTLMNLDACGSIQQSRLQLPEDKFIVLNKALNDHTYSNDEDVLATIYRTVACVLVVACLITAIVCILVVLLNIYDEDKIASKSVLLKKRSEEKQNPKHVLPNNKGEEKQNPKHVLPNNKAEEQKLKQDSAQRVSTDSLNFDEKESTEENTANQVFPLKNKEEEQKLKPDSAQRVFTGSLNFEEEIRVVLVGKTGVGKSSTGNSILGKKSFTTGNKPNAVTRKCETAYGTFQNKQFILVDTPGIYASDEEENDPREEIKKCIFLTSPGPHAVLFVVECGRIKTDDYQALNTFLDYFGKDLKRYVITVFTHSDKIDKDEAFESWMEQDSKLKSFLQEFNGGHCSINNNANVREKQVSINGLMYQIQTLKGKNIIWSTDSIIGKAEKKVKERQKQNEDKIRAQYEVEIKQLVVSMDAKHKDAKESEEMKYNTKIEKLHTKYKEKLSKVRVTTREEFLKTMYSEDFKNLILKKMYK